MYECLLLTVYFLFFVRHSACLELIAERESRLRQQWYQKILEEAQKGFRGTNYDHIHGSLLVVGKFSLFLRLDNNAVVCVVFK